MEPLASLPQRTGNVATGFFFFASPDPPLRHQHSPTATKFSPARTLVGVSPRFFTRCQEGIMTHQSRFITEARHLGDYRVWLRFDDGRQGIVDLADELWGEDLEMLRDRDIFSNWQLDPGLATLTWDHGIAFDPEDLYERTVSCH